MGGDELVEFLKSVEFFTGWSDADLAQLAASVELRNYDLGDNVVSVGTPGAGLFIVRAGSVRKFTEEQGKQITMGVCKERDVFGELAALRVHQYEFSARASSKAKLLFIPRKAFAPILERNKEAKEFMTNYATIVAAGGLVTQLFGLRGKVTHKELEEIIRSVGIKRVSAGQIIVEQGSVGDRRLYLVRQGQVRIKYVEDNNEFTLETVDKGDVFGEKACLTHQGQLASAIAETDSVLLVVPDKTVKVIIDRNPKLKEILEERIKIVDRELQRQKALAERQNRPILIDMQASSRRGERVLKRFPLVEQSSESDCGAACLAMICKHYGVPMTLGKLRELANVTAEGATLESLARVGESLGFTTRGVQTTHAAMKGLELPYIAHWEGYHYVVVYGVSKTHVWLADPALGFRKLSVSEFDKGWNGTCLLFTPGENIAGEAAARSPWLRFARYLKPYRSILGHLLMATLVVDILGLVPPVIVQNVLDQVVVHRDFDLLHILIVGMVLAQSFTQLTALLRAFLTNFMVRSLDFAMISHFYKHTLSLPYSFFMKRRTGEIFARFQENVTVRNFLTESTISTVLNLLMLFVYVTVLLLYNVNLTVLLVVMIIPIAMLTAIAGPILRKYARQDFETSTAAESLLMETLNAVETVKATSMERAMRMQWERRYVKALDVRYRAKKFDALFSAAGQILSGLTSVVILWVGASLVLSQDLTTGQLIAFNMLMGSVMSPIMGLIGLWQQVYEVGVAMERLGDVLDMEPEQKPESIATRIVLPDLRGDIRIENVFFRYGGNESPFVLENISLKADAGEVVAIVGQSGSGKTTLAKLLVGFYPPTEGKIFIDDYELSLLDKEYYRSQIGYVMQNNLLFSGTVADNIALGDENPDRRRIIEAAKLADAHGFINGLPLKYEQPVGERGVGLSGGQVQRVCIARALYREPRILILDEATSSLDAQSETNILRSMDAILKGRTALIIAHRLSTVMQADKILVLYAGRIVEEGPHEQLLQEKGMYYQLVQKQVAVAK